MSRSAMLSFDTALPAFVSVAVDFFGRDAFAEKRLLILRDAVGILTLIVRDRNLRFEHSALAEKLAALRPYVDEFPIATPDQLFDTSLYDDSIGFAETVELPDGDIKVQIVDRRIVGADWQRTPLGPISDTPVVVFWSLKGGVGRSTALCVAAASLAAEGLNVLAVDLDLEAPGIGEMLLNDEDRPEFGALDFFVESNFGPADENMLQGMVAPSRLTLGRGLLSVVPAIGRSTERQPQNMLAKLARSYTEKPTDEGAASFLDQTRSLVSRLTEASSYDVVLVDARAGLNESTAAALLGLGALVLLFGVDTPQTFKGYRYVFAHLNRFAANEKTDWRTRLQMVHAKAPANEIRRAHWRDSTFDLFSQWIYDEAEYDDVDAFNFDLDDETAPHYGWPILHDANFLEFDPIANPEQLNDEVTVRTFGDFVRRLVSQVGLSPEENNQLRF